MRTSSDNLADDQARHDGAEVVGERFERLGGVWCWVIIETNDAQESGYCGVSPAPLWRAIIEAEQC